MTQPLIANAILGIDTLWGGDVMCPSGTGRFIADSWFSDEPLPPAYTDPTAARVRESGGVSAKAPDRPAIEAYLAAVDVLGAIRGLKTEAAAMPGLRGEYLRGLALCFETMWDLAMEMLGKGEPVQIGTGRLTRSENGGRRHARSARRVPARAGALFRDHVGPRHGNARQRRTGSLRALRGSLHRPAPVAIRAHGQARTRRGTAGARRTCFAHRRRTAGRGGRVAQSALRSHGRDSRAGRGRDRAV